PNAIVETMIDRPEVNGVFEIPVQALDPPHLLVTESNVFRRHPMVGGADEALAVESLFGLDAGLVQAKLACLGLADVAAKGRVAAQRARGSRMGLSLKLVERLKTAFHLRDDVHALFLVPFGLRRVMDDHKAPCGRAPL